MVFLVGLIACEVLEPRPSAEEQAKRKKAEGELALFQEKHKQFNTAARMLIEEISLFKKHPGWPDMSKLIEVAPSLRYVEGDEEAKLKFSKGIAAWQLKWDTSWESMSAKYDLLVSRSQAMNERRVHLLDEWKHVWADFFAAVVVPSIEKEPSVGQVWLAVDTGTRSALDQYGVDSLGLFQKQQ